MKRFLFVLTLNLIAIVVACVNLFVLPESNPYIAVGGLSFSLIGGGLTLRDVKAKKQRKIAADQKREHEAAIAESSRLEDGLELGLGKDWAAEVTIDKINKELGLDDWETEMIRDAFGDPEPSEGGYITAGGITAEQVWVEPDCVQVLNGDGDVVAEFTEPGEEKELQDALTVIHKFKADRRLGLDEEASIITLGEKMQAMDDTIAYLNEQMRRANETRPFWGIP